MQWRSLSSNRPKRDGFTEEMDSDVHSCIQNTDEEEERTSDRTYNDNVYDF